MAVIIPNVVNWSVTPQNGQEDYFTKMNIWLSESTNVIASLSTAIVKINESNSESNDNLEEVLTARDQTVTARNEAVTAVATLTAGAIDNTTIAPNKAFSNQYIENNYYDKTEVDTAISESTLDINNLTDKPTPINTDNLALQETGGLLKKLSFSNLMNWVKSFSLGWGQIWQDVKTSRSVGTVFTNTSGNPIQVTILLKSITPNTGASARLINGTTVIDYFFDYPMSGNFVYGKLSAIIQAGETYKVEATINTFNIEYWAELR